MRQYAATFLNTYCPVPGSLVVIHAEFVLRDLSELGRAVRVRVRNNSEESSVHTAYGIPVRV